MGDFEGEDQRVAVKTLVLAALLIVVLGGLLIWMPLSELQDTITQGSAVSMSR